jgi:hypothetical protein
MRITAKPINPWAVMRAALAATKADLQAAAGISRDEAAKRIARAWAQEKTRQRAQSYDWWESL